jgi:hypothetical protein
VGNGQLQENSVNTNEIAGGAVDTDQLAGEAVTTEKIRGGAVTRAKIDGLAVGTNEIDDGAVTEVKIFDGAVTQNKLGPRAVTADKIDNNTITNLQIGPRAVDTGELADSAVTPLKLANLAVTTAKIANGAVTRDKIEDGAINRDKIGANSIGPDQLAPNSVRIEDLQSTVPGVIVQRGITTTGGLTAGYQDQTGRFGIGVSFGPGSGQVPRGNHTHTTGVVGAQTSTPNSTERVKKNIEEYEPVNIKNLLNLNPKKYQYKRSVRKAHQDLNKEWMHGYIVEELVSLGFTEPVGYDSEGLPDRLDYGLMSLLVLELVKVQQTEIDSLKEEVTRLKDTK